MIIQVVCRVLFVYQIHQLCTNRTVMKNVRKYTLQSMNQITKYFLAILTSMPDAVCVACLLIGESSTLMIPGTPNCPSSLQTEYSGYLMTTTKMTMYMLLMLFELIVIPKVYLEATRIQMVRYSTL